MDFITIGSDALASEFVETAQTRGHRLLAFSEQASPHVPSAYPGSVPIQSVEQIANFSVDFVVLAGGEKGKADRLRTLMRSEPIDLVFSTPLGSKPDVYYELGLWQQETGAKVLPLMAELFHPGLDRLVQLLKTNPVKTLELSLPLRRSEGIDGFCSGWHWLRTLAGEIDEITTIGSGTEIVVSTRYRDGQLGSVRYAARSDELVELHVRWDGGGLVCRLPNGFAGGCTISGTADGRTVEEEIVAAAPAIRWLEAWEAMSRPADGSLTAAATRQVELAAAVQRSLHYQRAVSLEYDEFSEEASFKGIMAASGCGLLWGIILIAILAAAGVPYVQYAVLPALLLFLLLQSLLGVVRRPASNSD